MRVAQLKIKNFRGIRSADLLFPKHVVLIGDSNTGKSTILEALDLTLGPDRRKRQLNHPLSSTFKQLHTSVFKTE